MKFQFISALIFLMKMRIYDSCLTLSNVEREMPTILEMMIFFLM